MPSDWHASEAAPVSRHAPLLSVIVPARNCAGPLWRCVNALASSELPRELWELIVVDDASDDDTAVVAAQFADMVILLPERAHGAAYARNRGVDVSHAELLVFVSADVRVKPRTLGDFLSALSDPRVGAVMGMYEYPDDRRAVTEYQALYNQFIRSRAAGDVDAFFAGLGAVRRSVFLRAGGFDEWTQNRPRVAAVELGHRIRAVGYRVVLDPSIRGAHLKRQALMDTLRLTLRDHGVPYDDHAAPSAEHENAGLRWVRQRERLSPLLCWLALDCVIVSLIIEGNRVSWWLAGIAIAAAVALNVPFFVFAMRQRGTLAVLRVTPLHFAGALLVGTARLVDRVFRSIVGEPRPNPAIEAFVEVGFKTWPPVPVRRAPIVSESIRS
jgi:GT2 family glycosyltransferase